MEQTTQFMIKLIANEVCGAPLELPFDLLSDEQLVIDLFSKAREHGVLHLVADALDRNSLLGTVYSLPSHGRRHHSFLVLYDAPDGWRREGYEFRQGPFEKFRRQ